MNDHWRNSYKTPAGKVLSLIYMIDKVVVYVIPMQQRQAGWSRRWSKSSRSQKGN